MNNPDVALPFNTLRCANRFKSVDMPEKQAEAIADELNEMININLVTKRDLKETEISLKQEMKNLELRLIIKLSAIMTVLIAAATSIIALIIKY